MTSIYEDEVVSTSSSDYHFYNNTLKNQNKNNESSNIIAPPSSSRNYHQNNVLPGIKYSQTGTTHSVSQSLSPESPYSENNNKYNNDDDDVDNNYHYYKEETEDIEERRRQRRQEQQQKQRHLQQQQLRNQKILQKQQQQQRQQQGRSASNKRRGQQFFTKSPQSSSNYDDDDDDHYHNIRGSSTDKEEEVYVVQQKHGYCSILFSIVQCTVLGLMMWQCGVAPLKLNPMIGPYPDALSEWGGKNSVLILEDNEWYRLITPIFLHAGIIHLLGNVLVQLETCAFFETEWGSIKWFLLYIISAIGSSICSTIFMPTAISVGSSGAVMGLFGAKLAEVFLKQCERIRTKQDSVAAEVRSEQCCAVTCSVIIVMAFSFIPFVDWAAHVGGLVSGFVVGIPLFACDIQNGWLWRIIWFIVGIAASIAMFVVSLNYMYNSGEIELIDELHDVCGYYKENYEDYECNCMREEYMNNNNNNNNNNNENNNDGNK